MFKVHTYSPCMHVPVLYFYLQDVIEMATTGVGMTGRVLIGMDSTKTAITCTGTTVKASTGSADLTRRASTTITRTVSVETGQVGQL